MDVVRRFHRPALRRPKALLAFEGWNDACEAASGAAQEVLEQFGSTEPFAVIDPEEFFDFKDRRPTVEIDDGGTRRLAWPTTSFYTAELPDRSHDLVIVLGEEPNLRWKTFSRALVAALADCGVEEAVMLGAFIGQVPHTRPVPIFGSSTDPERHASLGIPSSRYEGPTGIVGVLTEAFREHGIPASSLWAATPHYLAANANPAAMLALFRAADRLLRTGADDAELATVAAEFDERITVAMEASPDFASYVAELEEDDHEGASVVERASGGELVAEIEQYLRDHT